MEFIKPGTKINFVGIKWYAISISLLLILISCIFIVFNGLNYGIDFKGGTIIELMFDNDVAIADVRDALSSDSFGNAEIKYFGSKSEVLISTETTSAELEGLQNKVETALVEKFTSNPFSIERVEMVGPKIGKDLQRKAIWAVVLSWAFMLVYITIRFEIKFAFAAIIALVHDVAISVGIFTITGHKFNMPIMAAVLTIIGYSINDTIVVFDRIREDLRKVTGRDLSEIINMSINETLSRTVLTTLATLIAVLALYIYGAETIRDFAFMMMIGVIVGTYSSIYIASPVILFWKGKGIRLKK